MFVPKHFFKKLFFFNDKKIIYLFGKYMSYLSEIMASQTLLCLQSFTQLYTFKLCFLAFLSPPLPRNAANFNFKVKVHVRVWFQFVACFLFYFDMSVSLVCPVSGVNTFLC